MLLMESETHGSHTHVHFQALPRTLGYFNSSCDIPLSEYHNRRFQKKGFSNILDYHTLKTETMSTAPEAQYGILQEIGQSLAKPA